MAEIVIFGAGDIARIAHYYFSRDSEHKVVAFTVDAPFRETDEFMGLPVVDFEQVAQRYPPDSFVMFVALSYAKMNQVRASKYAQAKALDYRLVSYVSSHCTYLSDSAPGDNCFILEDNTVQPFVKIGNDVTLWSGNHIGHDSVIDDHCFIASQVVISGRVHVGPYCFIGVNATLRNAITIAPRTLIGAGTSIMKSTKEGEVYVPPRPERLAVDSREVEL